MHVRRLLAALAASGALALASAATASAAGEFVGPRGTFGSIAADPSNPGPGELVGGVLDVEVDPKTGDVFVLDAWGGNDTPRARVLRFSASGEAKAASPPVVLNRFQFPTDLAIQRSNADQALGKALIATYGGLRILDVDNLAAPPVVGPGGTAVASVAVDLRDGSYYAQGTTDGDTSSSRIVYKYTAAGADVRSYPRSLDYSERGSIPDPGNNTFGLVVDDNNGDLYVANTNQMWKIDLAADNVAAPIWSTALPLLPPLHWVQNEPAPMRIATTGGVTRLWTVHMGNYDPGLGLVRVAGEYKLGTTIEPGLKLGKLAATAGGCGFPAYSGYSFPRGEVSPDGRTWYFPGDAGKVTIIGPGADTPSGDCFEQATAGLPSARIAPVADAAEGTPVNLSGEPSTDDTKIARWEWDLDEDGAYDDASGKTVAHLFERGSAEIGLRVTDEHGATATAVASVAVLGPKPVARLTATPNSVEVGAAVQLDASTSTGERLSFRFDTGAGFQSNGANARKSVTFTTAGTKTVRVQLIDGDNRDATATATVVVTDPPQEQPRPEPTATPAPSATPAPTPVAKPGTLTIRSAKVSGSRVTVTLACAGGACAGSLAGKAGKLASGKGSFSLAAGKSGTVRLTLSSALRKKLAKGKVKVTFTATADGKSVKRTVSLTTKKGKR